MAHGPALSESGLLQIAQIAELMDLIPYAKDNEASTFHLPQHYQTSEWSWVEGSRRLHFLPDVPAICVRVPFVHLPKRELT